MSKLQKQTVAGFIISALLVLFVLFLRCQGQFLHPQFWSEDASGFFTEAATSPVKSIFVPYAGYFQVAVRLGAAVGCLFDPLWAPSIYLAFAVIYTLVPVFLVWLVLDDLSWISRVFLSTAVVLLPHPGVDFNNLLNSQWMLAASLPLILIWKQRPARLQQWIIASLLVFLGFQGPFGLTFIPLIIARAWWRRDVRSNALYYICWIIPALFQLGSVYSSPRFGRIPISAALHRPAGKMFEAIIGNYFGLFGGSGFYSGMLFIWLGYLVFLAATRNGPASGRNDPLIKCALLVGGGLLVLISASLSLADLSLLHPFVGNPRYFYIPFFVLTVVYLLLARTKVELTVTILLILVPQVRLFDRADIADLYWPSYVELAKAVGGVKIPINPQIQGTPGLYDVEIPGKRFAEKNILQVATLPQGAAITGVGWEMHPIPGIPAVGSSGLTVSLLENRPDGLVYEIRGVKPSTNHIAIGFSVSNEKSGWINVYFSAAKNFVPEFALRRSLPAGSGVYYFCRPSLGNTCYLRVEISQQSGTMVRGIDALSLR